MAGKTRIVVDFDKIYESNSCGKFKIIKDLGRDTKNRFYVRIKFIETGTEKDVRYDIAMYGRVRDELYGIDFNAIYTSIYYGQYKIIKYLGRKPNNSDKMVRIKFLQTGYEYDVILDLAQSGQVRDYSIHQQDRRIRTNNEECYVQIIFRILSDRWKAMIDRCYNQNNSKYCDYGESGVRVCTQWETLEGFMASIQFVPGFQRFYFQPEKYHLDKDYLQQNVPKSQRVYSPSTCIFLSLEDNSNLAIKEKYHGYHGVKKNPNGNYEVIFMVGGGHKKIFGTYSDYIVALNEYNYYYKLYGCYELVPLFNEGIPYVDHETAQKYLVSTNVK